MFGSSVMNLTKLGSGLCRFRDVAKVSQRLASTSTQNQPLPNRVEKTMNQVTLLGRAGGDPQKRGTQEHPVVIFSLATHSNYQYNTGDLLQKTDWHRVCIFKPYLRDTVYRYLTKGQRVLVQGRITYGEVKDENGVAHATTSIIAEDVTFFSSNKNEAQPETEFD